MIRPEVAELYAKRKEELKAIVAERYAEEKAWAVENPEKSEALGGLVGTTLTRDALERIATKEQWSHS